MSHILIVSVSVLCRKEPTLCLVFKLDIWAVAQCTLECFLPRLHGSYEALEGGWTEDGLVDFTGGLGSQVDLNNPDKLPDNFFEMLHKFFGMSTMMGSCIFVSCSIE